MANGNAKAGIRGRAGKIDIEIVNESKYSSIMSVLIENITEIALEFPLDARAKLAGKLLDSLDTREEFQETREARVTEIRRRVEEIKNGTAVLIDEEIAFARIDEMLAE